MQVPTTLKCFSIIFRKIHWFWWSELERFSSYSRTSSNGHLRLQKRPLFFVPADSPYIDSCLNLSTLATSLQRPLQRVPNCQNNLSTTGSFFSDWWKSRKWLSNMIRMARRWSMAAIIVSWLCCYFYCCSENKLTTILKANVASLARFVTWTWIWFKTLVKFLCTLRLYNYYIWMDYHYEKTKREHEPSTINMFYSSKKFSYYFLPPHNGHFHLSPMWLLWRGSTVLNFLERSGEGSKIPPQPE